MRLTRIWLYAIYVGAVLLVGTASPCIGVTYYVSTSGDDENPGSRDRPWRTIQKAADTMNAGDSCRIFAGDYGERVTISRSGGPGGMISYISEEDTVKTKSFHIVADHIRVSGLTIQADQCDGTWGYGIKLSGDHSVIENNYLYYCPRGGINLTAEADSNTIRYNDCYRNGLTGISVDGTNNLCEYNEIWGTIVEHAPTGCVNEDSDGVRFFGTGHRFRGNYIHDINYSGDNQGYSPHIDGFQTFWWSGVQDSARDCVFEYNLVDLPYYKQGGASAKGWEIEDSRDLVVRNNIIRGNWGIRCEARNVKILNNTLVGDRNLTEDWQVGVRLHDAAGSVVQNNIIVDFDDMAVETTGANEGAILDYNCTSMGDGRIPGGNPGPHDLWGINPIFTNPAGDEFSLQPASPCRDAGIELGDLFDEGLRRNSVWTDGVHTLDQDDHGPGWEIGAYVFEPVEIDTTPPDAAAHRKIKVDPVP